MSGLWSNESWPTPGRGWDLFTSSVSPDTAHRWVNAWEVRMATQQLGVGGQAAELKERPKPAKPSKRKPK